VRGELRISGQSDRAFRLKSDQLFRLKAITHFGVSDHPFRSFRSPRGGGRGERRREVRRARHPRSDSPSRRPRRDADAATPIRHARLTNASIVLYEYAPGPRSGVFGGRRGIVPKRAISWQ
jgi:hypothetical protein